MKRLLLCLTFMTSPALAGDGSVWVAFATADAAEKLYCIPRELEKLGVPTTADLPAEFMAMISSAPAAPYPLSMQMMITLRTGSQQYITSSQQLVGNERADESCRIMARNIAVKLPR